MGSSTAVDVVHHLYLRPGDLLPCCGAIPGPDAKTDTWHTGHDLELLLECVGFGLTCCSTCLFPGNLDGWTPLIFDEESEQDDTGDSDDPWWDDR